MTGRGQLPRVDPLPGVAPGRLPWVGSGFALLRDPTRFFADSISRLGDTFVVDALGYRLFCVFSPAGVRALYALPEREASKGAADLALLSHKVPTELWAGRRNFPHQLFGSQEVEGYLGNLERAVEFQLEELGDAGSFEIFAFTRRLGHRVGLASWAGVESASPEYLDRLIPLFDRLDASESFVRPVQAFTSIVTRKTRERRAMRGIEIVIGEILERRDRLLESVPSGDFLAQIADSWSDTAGRMRVEGIARDLMVIHMGSQSNLFAAMAWTIIDLLARPALLDKVRGGDLDLLERCANESIRMAQRSITLRRVLRPIELTLESGSYRLEPGVMLTTMLSVTNRSSAAGLDEYDPDRYRGRRLIAPDDLPARELVSTFGHGAHSCPAQRFSISSIRTSLQKLFDAYELTPRYADPEPLRRQIGGVSRADRPCRVEYRRR